MNPMLFIASLAGLAIFIVAITHATLVMRQSMKNSDEQAVTRKPNKKRPIEKKPEGLSADFSALIDAIAEEGQASRDEEKREDDLKQVREWLTIALLVSTVVLLGWQVSEMVKVYEPIQTQAEAAITVQRAWIGPTDANIVGAIVVGQGIKATVQYANTGREPGTAFVPIALFKVFDLAAWNDGSAFKYINEFSNGCMSATSNNGSVSFPTLGATQYQLHPDSNAESGPEANRIVASQKLIDGAEVIALTGCLIYHSISKVHHTSFCFYYKAKESDLAHLTICTVGSNSD
jgi:hypothetical protein